MNRKLHNTVMAMIASSSLFVLGLLTSTPAMPGLSPVSTSTQIASIDHEDATATGDQADRVEAAPRRHVRRSRQQSVAMPFFSFAPRG